MLNNSDDGIAKKVELTNVLHCADLRNMPMIAFDLRNLSMIVFDKFATFKYPSVQNCLWSL